MGNYLLKIKEIGNKPVSKELILKFHDETKKVPGRDFELYKYLYGKEAGSITGEQIAEMKSKYVGKELDLLAYETGQFGGFPDDYFKYSPSKAGTGFGFSTHLVIIKVE